MRLRSIFPALWQAETFASMSWDARFMLMGLWSYADDEGRGLDKVALIAAALLPFDLQRNSEETFERAAAAVDELCAAGAVTRYEVEGTKYLVISDWGEWQKPQRPTPSRFPAPTSGITKPSGGLQNPPEDSGGFPLGVRSSEHGNARASTGARSLVQSVIPRHYPRGEIMKLAAKTTELLSEGTPAADIESALRLWLTKPNAGPGLLPGLVSEVIKNREAPANGTRPGRSTVDTKVEGWLNMAVGAPTQPHELLP
jgi:hypothetical protein